MAPLLEAVGKLHGGRVPQICTGVQAYFRDVADHLTRIEIAIDSMRDTIGTAIHVNLSMVTIEEAEVTKRLAAWAAIFAVCTAFAGIWGMNFERMPELMAIRLRRRVGAHRLGVLVPVLPVPQGGLVVAGASR